MIWIIERDIGVWFDFRDPRKTFHANNRSLGAFAGSIPRAIFLTKADPELASKDCILFWASWSVGVEGLCSAAGEVRSADNAAAFLFLPDCG